ncbi:MAG: DUF5916 domain-containing protein [Gemmatimonadaceae bacterium]
MPRHRWRLALYAAVLAALAATRATAQTTASTAAPGAPTASRRTTDGHAASVPVATAAERRGAITIDGRLDEAAWAAAEPITDFTQLDPDEGRPISERTEVRILYDGAALYIAARMWDQRGAAGVQTRLVRRDQQMDSDWFEVVIDSFHDHLGRAFFRVNPSGVKFDALGQGNSNPDAGWDPIWEAATSVGVEGWTAEYRIPLSQLRFPRAERQTWGLQVRRFISRRNEYAQWSHWGKNDVGGPSRFGHLEGLHLSAQPRHAEVLPYVVAVSRHVQPEVRGDPFNDGSRQELRGGADLKYGVTTNLTLDATFNPDFGQVEVDPAVVNLSQFETFFPERRPFFVEGMGIFSFGSFSCFFCSNVSSLESFYTRRIGRHPQGSASGRYVDVPENSTILGAAKLTGRTSQGWSVGALNAVTRREMASVVTEEGARARQEVEPLTNYFIGRLKRDYRGGNVVLGAIATSTLRRDDDADLATSLSRHAEMLGTDWQITWKNRKYSLMGSAAASNVNGDSLVILRLQRSGARYFQRPDRDPGTNGVFSDSLDTGLTSLRGYGFYSRLAKDAGHFMWETMANVRSPGYEVNDIGIQGRADYYWMNGNLHWFWSRPTRVYRSFSFITGAQQQLNFDGDLTDRQVHAGLFGQLANFWQANLFSIYRPETFDDRLTRGGPVVRRASLWFHSLNLETDTRKWLVLATNPSYSRNAEGAWSAEGDLSLTVRPASNVSVSLGPSFSRSGAAAQYVTAPAPVEGDTSASLFGHRHYVFSDLVQRTVSMNTRVNVTFSPTLTLELFAQPFIASADYSAFKEFARPRALAKRVYGRDVGQISTDAGVNADAPCYSPSTGLPARCVRVDPDGAGGTDGFAFGDPDFNLRSLRGNAVARWEYRPGSTVFLVWQQSRSETALVGDLDLARDRSALLRRRPDNIFLVKFNYWLGL